MNNTTNRIKKRADILTDYIVDKVERLEKENRYLADELRDERSRGLKSLAEIMKYRAPFRKVLESVKSVSKCNKGEIEIIVNGQLCPHIYPNDPIYPLAEKLLEEYDNKVKFEKSFTYNTYKKENKNEYRSFRRKPIKRPKVKQDRKRYIRLELHYCR